MFKKLMAVALTAVMAVSMLTGCSFADAAKQSALVKALNNESVQKEVTSSLLITRLSARRFGKTI